MTKDKKPFIFKMLDESVDIQDIKLQIEKARKVPKDKRFIIKDYIDDIGFPRTGSKISDEQLEALKNLTFGCPICEYLKKKKKKPKIYRCITCGFNGVQQQFDITETSDGLFILCCPKCESIYSSEKEGKVNE